MTAYYNEIEPYAAQWLRNLIEAGQIAPGVVDERDIRDVVPSDLAGFTQCHFFAGIGVWSHALRRAGWPDNRPVWTGSCPCQPFSAAGRRGGASDERHLWPHWQHLIRQSRPSVVLGEQVASSDGLIWLDLVSNDLEAEGYAFGAADLSAASFGGAHIRQRLYFVGMDDPTSARYVRALEGPEGAPWDEARLRLPGSGRGFNGLADFGGVGPGQQDRRGQDAGEAGSLRGEAWQQRIWIESDAGGGADGLAHAERRDGEQHAGQRARSDGAGSAGAPSRSEGSSDTRRLGSAGTPKGFWRDCDWLFCRDGKWRPVESGTFPLAYAAPARVGRLRAYGNGLDAETAENFVGAVMDISARDFSKALAQAAFDDSLSDEIAKLAEVTSGNSGQRA